MVRRSLRSRTLRRISKKTPGARIAVHFEKRKPKKSHCSQCGAVLMGVPRLRNREAQNTARTFKRPERAFGGVLCSRCSRIVLKEKAKSLG